MKKADRAWSPVPNSCLLGANVCSMIATWHSLLTTARSMSAKQWKNGCGSNSGKNTSVFSSSLRLSGSIWNASTSDKCTCLFCAAEYPDSRKQLKIRFPKSKETFLWDMYLRTKSCCRFTSSRIFRSCIKEFAMLLKKEEMVANAKSGTTIATIRSAGLRGTTSIEAGVNWVSDQCIAVVYLQKKLAWSPHVCSKFWTQLSLVSPSPATPMPYQAQARKWLTRTMPRTNLVMVKTILAASGTDHSPKSSRIMDIFAIRSIRRILNILVIRKDFPMRSTPRELASSESNAKANQSDPTMTTSIRNHVLR
mmetsp:Transcript_61429/g.146449  ORF Transcript_61429/g.146449 Transcript_61429/m.146449 type:complete len:308 (-) Transcript_61429:775-1698(-)